VEQGKVQQRVLKYFSERRRSCQSETSRVHARDFLETCAMWYLKLRFWSKETSRYFIAGILSLEVTLCNTNVLKEIESRDIILF
jgi:hypothetical protein